MNWFADNWYVVFGIIAFVVVVGFAVYKFLGLPTKDQVEKIKQWLLYAVTIAEQKMGSGTGQLKLRYVYDWFVDKFPITAKLISFEKFSKWVDEALEVMRKWLAENESIREIVIINEDVNSKSVLKINAETITGEIVKKS